jgi:hypothetical protein
VFEVLHLRFSYFPYDSDWGDFSDDFQRLRWRVVFEDRTLVGGFEIPVNSRKNLDTKRF